MDEFRKLLEELLNKELLQLVFSGCRHDQTVVKIRIRPLLVRGNLMFQAAFWDGKKEKHVNYEKNRLMEDAVTWMERDFKQMQGDAVSVSASVLVSKKGRVTIKKRQLQEKRPAAKLAHNRKKQYILEEGKPVPFLVELGVMTPEGRVVNSRYDKFRQINRFLEFIEDICPCLPRKFGYDKLQFLTGDIADYEGVDQVDLVVTLHACDMATDYALAKAVSWNARAILSVPCCQHELNGQIRSEILQPVLKYGLLKERMAALITDGLRASLLEQQGYEVQVLEFIDMEHTPKNILIRAVKKPDHPMILPKHASAVSGGTDDVKLRQCMEALHVDPALRRLLGAEKQESGEQ